MDTNTLVESLIEDGRMLVAELPTHGFEVAGAVWLQASRDGQWYFYIVSPMADAQGLNKAYRALLLTIRAMSQRFSIDPLTIRLIGPSHPIAHDVLAVPDSGSRILPLRWAGTQLGNVSIEGAYLYPPASVP